MMAGGPDESIAQLAPILDVLAPPDGWRHFGATGAGHFVKMVHNGVEYGMMQAYAEGFDLMHQSDVPDRAQGGRGALEPRLGRALLAVRAGRAGLRAGGQRPQGPAGLRRRLRRGPLDDGRRDRDGGADARRSPPRSTRASTRARKATTPPACSPRCATSSAATRSRRSRRPEMAVDVKPDPQALGENPLIEGLERLPVPATTLTIFGVTGDLAHRKLLPALYNLAHEGALPERFNLVGVARREMPDDEFRAVAQGRDREVLAPRDRRDRARGPARPHALRRLLVRRRRRATAGCARRSTSSTRRAAASSTAPTTSRPRRSTSR